MPEHPALLHLEDYGFVYRGAQVTALNSVHLTLRSGEAVAVLGAQGAGTSTLARAVAGLLDEHGHSAGIRLFSGSRIGMLGEDPEAQLTGLTRTVWDEAALPGRLLGRPLQACLSDAQDSLAALGIWDLADRQLSTLSGGERQLTALAGLLTLRPEVLVLDQPSQALDHGARDRLARCLEQFRANGGAVLITGHQHDELTATCGRVVFLDHGRLAEVPPSSTVHAAAADRTELDRHGVWHTQNQPVADAHAPPPSRSDGGRALLTVTGLSVRRSGTQVLDGVGLELRAGETTVLRGANGSGKSTLLSALAGGVVTEPQTRIADSAGRDLAVLPAHLRAGCLAWVGQDPGEQLSASTVRGELHSAVPLHTAVQRHRGGRRLRREERQRATAERAEQVQQVMTTAALSHHADDHPYDLLPARRKDCVIASALLLNPSVLLLDEPTLGRDAKDMARLSALLKDFTDAGGAVLVATHDERWAAEIGDHQLHLRDGRLAEL